MVGRWTMVGIVPLYNFVSNFISWCTKCFIWKWLQTSLAQGVKESFMSKHENKYARPKDSLHRNNHAGSSLNWVRPLSYVETFMTQAQKYGCMKTVYALWLDTKKPIDITLVKQAAHITNRKMPHLQLSVGYRNRRPWWKKRNSETLDVEVVTSQDVIWIMEANLKHQYDLEEGPLWFVRLVKNNQNEENMYNSHKCYKYALVFGFLHNIADGTTNMAFCNQFISILNDLIEGHPPNMAAEGVFAEPLEDRLANEKSNRSYLCKLFFEHAKKAMCFGAGVCNFTKNYPLPVENEACTRILHHEVDEITTKRLLKKCKMEKVTINSAFTAAANLGLYKLISEKDVGISDTVINTLQTVNMRRYWSKEAQPNSFGCRISSLNLNFSVAHHDAYAFWEYARDVHRIIKHGLDEKPLALLGLPLANFFKYVIGENFWVSKFSLPSSNDCHFCVTNMGNLDNILIGTLSQIKVSQIMRSVSGHFMPTLCQHTLQTFHGRLCYSIDYYTQKMKESTAEKYSKYIVDILKESIPKV
ncbi:unnamed protein product [Meganyctiphanes norvegica]|uniref:Uncharacterized protein n=1 Tax=Meganyctiphanes norvegica TaxID=48144 RepID=A0AAV2QJ58_MEGNR